MKKIHALIHAVTHIRLHNANRSKLAALDTLAAVYLPLCQEYIRYFCTQSPPDKFANPVFPSTLSQRWQRVAIQQATGIAQSWRSNRDKAYAEFSERCDWYNSLSAAEQAKHKAPEWNEWRLPQLHQVCIQANVNVVATLPEREMDEDILKLETAQKGQFDYWLQIATLEKRKPIYIPIKLAAYHQAKLAGQTLNTSVTLHRRQDGSWWLTLTFDQPMPEPVIDPQCPRVAGDIGIANFLTSSTGKHYGTFHGKLAHRFQLDRDKRQRKAKLRACLEKQGVEKLPSTSSVSGQRLTRHVRQEINRAVNRFLDDHPDHDIVLERLSPSTMRFKSKRMNAYLYASNLGHIPKQIAWAAAKRGLSVVYVNPAYSSQECSRCHHTARANRPDQRTFRCGVCGYEAHADENASVNIASRYDDAELAGCTSLEQVKALLLERHRQRRESNGWP
jgi:IS605 OrfB family transposase